MPYDIVAYEFQGGPRQEFKREVGLVQDEIVEVQFDRWTNIMRNRVYDKKCQDAMVTIEKDGAEIAASPNLNDPSWWVNHAR